MHKPNPAMIKGLAGRLLFLACLSGILSSCSAEPSAKDISDAINSAIKAEQSQLKTVTNGLASNLPGGTNPFDQMMSVEISDLEKIGCRNDGEKAYVCDVSYTISGGLMGSNGRSMAVPVRMVDTNSGWIVSAR